MHTASRIVLERGAGDVDRRQQALHAMAWRRPPPQQPLMPACMHACMHACAHWCSETHSVRCARVQVYSLCTVAHTVGTCEGPTSAGPQWTGGWTRATWWDVVLHTWCTAEGAGHARSGFGRSIASVCAGRSAEQRLHEPHPPTKNVPRRLVTQAMPACQAATPATPTPHPLSSHVRTCVPYTCTAPETACWLLSRMLAP